ncbi:MAG: protein kinase, partial [Myxococcaceae bacterium]|nr:protein kinase [Myxococcaceae bacterium]
VLDFGISKLKGSGAEQTTDSVLMGTPRYMSPEQALGKNRDVSPASDVFSLGSIAYECLSGTAPFVDESIARVVFRIAYEPHAPLPSVAPGVPDAMARAVEHALQKDLAQRTPDVATFVLELTGQALSSVPRPALAPEGPRGAVAQAGTPVDESVMGGATVASSRGGTPVAAPAPAVVVLPAVATPPVGAHPPRAGGPPRLVVGAVLVVVVAVTTFLVARSLDGASERAGAGSGAPGASSGPGADAGVRLQPVELPDAGPAAVTPGDGGPEPDARPGAVAVSGDGGMDVGGGPDGGPGRADDAGVRLVRPVMRPPAVLEPPSPADLALLETLEARLAEGAWEEVWLRRAMASQFTSPAGRRDHAIMMTEVACKRGDLSGANGFFRQLPSGAARELAQRRCRKHRVDFTLE